MIGREQGHWQSAADAPHSLARLLRARRERPRRRPADKRDELAPPHVGLPGE